MVMVVGPVLTLVLVEELGLGLGLLKGDAMLGSSYWWYFSGVWSV